MLDQIRQAKSELAEICRRHNVRRLDLFGSAVGSNFDPRTSDLDFLVEFGPFTKGEYSEHYFALIEDLKSLFGRPVDVVVSRAVRNSVFTGEHLPHARGPVCRVTHANTSLI
jgi:predicted nucleotidyltransferase